MKNALTFLLLILINGALAGQNDAAALRQLQVDVVYLSSDLLQGREAGTPGERMAADYIASRFAQIGLKPAGRNGTWFYQFDFKYNPNPHAAGGEARKGINVAGYIDNKAQSTVVIGAHYDHLGHGAFGSRHKGEPAVHTGADDNASGVGGLFQLAQHLKTSKKARKNNYLFVAFSAEELGLIGSKIFASDSLFFDKKRTNYVLNMDMIGRLNEEKVLAVNGAGTSPAWKPALETAARGTGLTVKTTDSGMGASDHTSFYLQDIPVLHFFSGQHSDYHTPADDSEKINYEGLLGITNLMTNLIEQLDGQGKLAFTKTKDEEQGRRASSFKVSLGVMPDYVYDGEGMRVDGVTDGKPAQAAGVQKGDIIIGIGDVQVKTIQDYMGGLSKFNTGDATVLKINRNGQVLELPVKF